MKKDKFTGSRIRRIDADKRKMDTQSFRFNPYRLAIERKPGHSIGKGRIMDGFDSPLDDSVIDEFEKVTPYP